MSHPYQSYQNLSLPTTQDSTKITSNASPSSFSSNKNKNKNQRNFDFDNNNAPGSSTAAVEAAIHINAPDFDTSSQYPQLGSTDTNEPGTYRVSRYSTNLNLRLDFEASLAYFLFIFSGVFFLIFERQNDYVRFHAWQSCLLSISFFITFLFVSLILPFLSTILTFLFFATSYYMSYRAYIDSGALDYYKLPYIGNIAFDWVSSE